MDGKTGHDESRSPQGEANPAGVLTQILSDLRHGDVEARRRLVTLAYDELRELAAVHLRGERTGHTLQPTALVHEAFLRLFGNVGSGWENRAHFFGAAGEAMRRILVDYARRRNAAKRGGGVESESFTDAPTAPDRLTQILAVDEALERLGAEDERKRKLVELRFFAGLTLEEAATTLDISLRTTKRDWAFAKAWLYRELSDGEEFFGKLESDDREA
jgi:RNA polymerase sigma factor (TIGR02999 family)